MLIYNLLLFAAWVSYGMFHSALATSSVKLFFAKKFNLREKAYRIFYNLFAVLSIIPLIYFGFYVRKEQIFTTTIFSNIVALLCAGLGLIIMILVINKYFKQMAGIDKTANEQLYVNGLHGLVRHPLYTGTFLFLIGIFLYLPQINILISTLGIILYTFFAVRWEEQKLFLSLGEQYKTYCASTPRFIPRFLPRKTIDKT